MLPDCPPIANNDPAKKYLLSCAAIAIVRDQGTMLVLLEQAVPKDRLHQPVLTMNSLASEKFRR
jgi:hypothetical protein